jgi:hypothetical protein
MSPAGSQGKTGNSSFVLAYQLNYAPSVKTIVFPTDLSPAAGMALSVAVAIAWLHNATVVLLRV